MGSPITNTIDPNLVAPIIKDLISFINQNDQ